MFLSKREKSIKTGVSASIEAIGRVLRIRNELKKQFCHVRADGGKKPRGFIFF
jgi:hypothetical protein